MRLPPLRIAFSFGLCVWLGCATAPPTEPAPEALPELPRSTLQSSEPAAVVDVESAARARVVEAARSMLGVPYRYGGGTTDGIDCSGLVRYSYELGGFPGLPHSSRELYERTERISISELKPGDLLFFKFRGRNVSHVAIYLGGDEFVHVAKTTQRVERVRIDHPYWRREVHLAGRVRWSAQSAAR